jgi:hypothetical protein
MEHQRIVISLNRTILELKPRRTVKRLRVYIPLNRTILELKRFCGARDKTSRITLNRTILELKLLCIGDGYFGDADPPFRQTDPL